MPIRTVVQHGPKNRKVAAATDDRSGRAGDTESERMRDPLEQLPTTRRVSERRAPSPAGLLQSDEAPTAPGQVAETRERTGHVAKHDPSVTVCGRR